MDMPPYQQPSWRMRTASATRRLIERTLHRRVLFVISLSLIGFFVCASIVAYLGQPPRSFPVEEQVEIPRGFTLSDAARRLKEERVVRSATLLQMAVMLGSLESDVKAGVYFFDRPVSVFSVARAITTGSYDLPPVHITVIEGLRSDQIAEIAAAESENITVEEFHTAAEGKEGYLFPETYFLPEYFTAQDFVDLMVATFNDAIEPYRDAIRSSEHSLEDIVTMASLIEREANSEESMRMVSGILWKRLAFDMPLQVDAAFEYIYRESSANLKSEDLRVNSPYNTYTNTGLPPTPIANPGLGAIEAALEPEPSPYLFYLTAPDGTFHYAKTYAEHKRNVDRYLR